MFGHIDISAALTRIADKRIEEAIEAGKFKNLQGAGKPLDLEPMPADENARMMWWAMRIFRQNDVIPDEIRYRKRIDSLKGLLATTRKEEKVIELVGLINGYIQKLNTMGTNVKETDVYPVDLERELAAMRLRVRGG